MSEHTLLQRPFAVIKTLAQGWTRSAPPADRARVLFAIIRHQIGLNLSEHTASRRDCRRGRYAHGDSTLMQLSEVRFDVRFAL